MNGVYIAQVVGTVSIFLLFCVKLFIIANPRLWQKSGKVADLWTIIYIFFLFTLRALQLIGIGDLNSLRIISGFSAAIPLIGVIAHLILFKEVPELNGSHLSLEEAKAILQEAKQIKVDAQASLHDIKEIENGR